jgi:hypothetical protein
LAASGARGLGAWVVLKLQNDQEQVMGGVMIQA